MRLVGSAQWRVALALVFLLISSLQGTLFASAGAYGMMAATDATHHQMVAGDAASAHHHHQTADADVTGHDAHGSKSIADKACEVHCAPASALVVNTADIVHAEGRCFAPAITSVLIDGNYAEFIRPPRLT
jgi:hypothetical protein